ITVSSADLTPPTVTAPAPITIYATVPGGATPGTVPALATFLTGASAIDDQPGVPTAQTPTLNGVAITATTVFALGANTVTFAFRAGAGTGGPATSVVTVLAGRPTLTVGLVGVAVTGTGQQTVTLRLTNTGAGTALNVNAALSGLKTQQGTGTMTVVSGLPANNPLLAPGQSFDFPIVVNVPPTVLRCLLSLSLTMSDSTGAPISAVVAQTIVPVDVTPPTVLNNGPTLGLTRTS